MQLQVFKYEDDDHILNQIGSVEIDGELWFSGVDVARTLGYKRPSDAIRQHCKPKGILKESLPTHGGLQEVLLINEPNIYRLIVKSKLESADRFETWLFEEVIPTIRKKGFYGKIDRAALPNFIARYRDNYHKLPNDHFSVISEMFVRLYTELEKVGYSIPDKAVTGSSLMPDISVGRGFADFLRKKGSDYYDTHKTYKHSFPDGREVDANMYHIEALPMFIRYINEVWIPENATKYFRERDPLALDYLPKLLGSGAATGVKKEVIKAIPKKSIKRSFSVRIKEAAQKKA